MQAHLNPENWRRHVRGWQIDDCLVVQPNRIALRLSAQEKEGDAGIQARLLQIHLHLNDEAQCSAHTFSAWPGPQLGLLTDPAGQRVPHVLLSADDKDGQLCLAAWEHAHEEFIEIGAWPHIRRLRQVREQSWAIGARCLYLRSERGTWLPQFAPAPEQGELRDMDAFSSHEIYAIGAYGEVWQSDGRRWRLAAELDQELCALACGGNGVAYIGAADGSLWQGRDGKWRQVRAGWTAAWQDMQWHLDRLWLAAPDCMRQWDGKRMTSVNDPWSGKLLRGRLDGRYGWLLQADAQSVRAFDGQQWRLIVAPVEES
ncbi:hypothetical protein V8J88_04760 [Massilia sp. W12]|uniref:hypothetical protein n=1 Tax=Massilia sp. W12 TaxID=3126507 RepID=UPI0030D4B0FD